MTQFIRTLSNHKYAQAHVTFYDDGTIALFSYTTCVIEIDPAGFLLCTGTYSRTTISHIDWFLKEYVPTLNYYDAKSAYIGNYKININTRQIIPR